MEKHYVYLAEILTYGTWHPVKVGVSKNPEKRMRQLNSMNIHCAALRIYYEFPRIRCFEIERKTYQNFPRAWWANVVTREALKAPIEDIAAFIESFDPISINYGHTDNPRLAAALNGRHQMV